MKYKLFIEEGDYKDLNSGDRRNLMIVESAETPDGLNVGWDDFATDTLAFLAYNIKYDPIDASVIEEPELTMEEQIVILQTENTELLEENEILDQHLTILINENSNQIPT